MSATRMFERFRKLLDVDWTNIADGQFLKRQGTLINGGTPSGGGSAEFPTGHLFGLTMSNNVVDATNDIDVGPGECRDVGDSADMVLAALITKRLDAGWVVGTGQGGLDTGVVANGTYHIFLIKRTDTSVVDVLFSVSVGAPTMPSGYTLKRRVGSIMRVAGVNVPFTQRGDEFLRKVGIKDVDVSNLGATSVLYTLSLPTGIQVEAIITALVYHSSAVPDVLITSTDQADSAASPSLYTIRGSAGVSLPGQPRIRTSVSAQIRAVSDQASTFFVVITHGWVDTRDRPTTGGGSVVVEAATYPRSHLVGLGLSNNATDATNDIDVAEGECRDSTNAMNMVLPSAITKRLDAAWVVGTNQGGLDTGAIANTTYHVFVIKRSDTGVVDVLFSTSASVPTLPANYSHFRRVGSIMRVVGVITPFTQKGDEFLRKVTIMDVNATTLGNTAVLYTLSVPTGIQVGALISIFVYNTVTTYGLLTSPDQTDIAPTALDKFNFLLTGSLGQFVLFTTRTNTSAQVRARADNVNTTLYISTVGWIDTRGRDN